MLAKILMQPSKYKVLIGSLSVNKEWSKELMLSMLLRPHGRYGIYWQYYDDINKRHLKTLNHTKNWPTFSCLNQSKMKCWWFLILCYSNHFSDPQTSDQSYYLFILYFNSVENHKKRRSKKKCSGLYILNKYKLK